MAADPMTGFDPDTDEDLKQANARFVAAGDQAKADAAHAAFTTAAPAAQQPNGLQHWFQDLPQNIGSGLITAAVNTADAMHSGLRYVDQKAAEAHQALGGESADVANRTEQGEAPQTPEYAQVRNAVNDFKQKYVDVPNPDMADRITQGVSQFAIPFLGWSKAVSVVGGASKLAAMGRTILAEGATAGTAMAPHDGRFADMLDLGRHTEGKFADALNAISPNGSLVNNYIDYMTGRTDEGEAEGRAKNIIDTITGGAVISPLLTAGMRVLKGGMTGLKYAMENGVGSLDQIGIPNQAGRIGEATPRANNASGESAASQEAINAVALDKEQGVTTHILHQDDTVTPVTGVETRDVKALPGDVVVRMHDGKPIVLDRGGLPLSHVQGRVNAALSRGQLAQDMSLSADQRALERERVAAQRQREDGIIPEHVPEIIPPNAAKAEGEAARRNAHL